MFKLDNIDNICDKSFYTIKIGNFFWVVEKGAFFNENNFHIIALYTELLEVLEKLPRTNSVNDSIRVTKKNLEIAQFVNDFPGIEVTQAIDNRNYCVYSITTDVNYFNYLSEIFRNIGEIFSKKSVDFYEETAVTISAMRRKWKTPGICYINTEDDHKKPVVVSKGDIVKTMKNLEVSGSLVFNYYSDTNLNCLDKDYLVNHYGNQDPFIKKSKPIYFIKDGYYHNNIITRQEPLFDYEDSDYFSTQQKESIFRMEKLEAENAITINEAVSVNKVVVKTNFGILANNPGTGKTRVAAAVAIRNVIKTRNIAFSYEPGLSLYVEKMDAEHEDHDEYIRCNQYGGVETTKNWRAHERKVFNTTVDISYRKNNSTLIVVPLSTFGQWQNEITELLREFELLDEVSVQYIKQKQKGKDVSFAEGAGAPDIILVTNTFYNTYIINLENQKIMFNRVIFDECDTNKYSLGNEGVQGRFKWLISATVNKTLKEHLMGVKEKDLLKNQRDRDGSLKTTAFKYNHVGDIETAGLSFKSPVVCQKIIDYLNIFVPKDAVDNIKYLNFIEYRNLADVAFLDRIGDVINAIDPALAEAFASGNEEEISRILGESSKGYCKTDRMYNVHLLKLKDLKETKLDDKIKKPREDAIRKNLKDLDNRLYEIFKDKLTDCSICLGEMNSENVILYDCCTNFMHKECAGHLHTSNHSKTKCPTCRADPAPVFNFVDTIWYKRVGRKLGSEVSPEDDPEGNEEDPENSGSSFKKKKIKSEENEKPITVRNDIFLPLFNDENRKIIVYATCKEKDGVMAYLKDLKDLGFVHNVLKGNVTQRSKAISEFKSGLVPILVLLEHKNAAGVNLTEATDLVVYNRTSNEILKQVVGRVDRFGLDHTVNIHLMDKFETTLEAIRGKYGECKITPLETPVLFSSIEELA